MFSPDEKQQLADAASQYMLDRPHQKLARYLKDNEVTSLHLDWGPEAHRLSFDERCELVYGVLTSTTAVNVTGTLDGEGF